MAMIQVSVAARSTQALPCVSRDYGDLNAFSWFSDSPKPGPEESPEVRPQRPISAWGLGHWVVIVRQQLSGWSKLVACGACCYVVTKNGVHNKPRRE